MYNPLNTPGPKNPPIIPPIILPGTAPIPPNNPQIAAPIAVPAFAPATKPAAPAIALSRFSPNNKTSIKIVPKKPNFPRSGANSFFKKPPPSKIY